MVRQALWPRSRLGAIALTLGLLGLGTTAATLAVDEALRRALDVSMRNPMTQALYPWTVRLDITALLVLASSIGVVTKASGHVGDGSGPVAWRRLLVCSIPLLAVAAVAAYAVSPLSAVATVLLYAAALWLGPRLAGAADAWVPPLLVIAFTLRAAVGVGLSAYGEPGHGRTTFDDEQAVHNAAHQLAAIMAAGVGDLDPEWRHLMGSQLDVMGTLYVFLGPDFTVVRLANVCLGTLTVALVYAIANAWRGRPAARAASVLVALWPTLVLWSGTGLREPLSIFLTLVFPWLLLRRFAQSAQPFQLLAVVTGVLALLLLAVLRPPAALAIATALLLGALVAPWPSARRLLRALPVAATVVVGIALIVVSWRMSRDPAAFLSQLSPRALEYREAAAELTPQLESDRSKLPDQPEPSFMVLSTIVRAVPPGEATPQTGILYSYTRHPSGYEVLFEDGTRVALPASEVQPLSDANIGWSDLIGRPARALRLLFAPSGPGEPARRLVTAPDTVVWDALLVVAALGAAPALRRAGPEGVVLVIYPLLLVLGLALLSTNLGTLVRHRSIVVPWLALLAAPLAAPYAARVRRAPAAEGLAVACRPTVDAATAPEPRSSL